MYDRDRNGKQGGEVGAAAPAPTPGRQTLVERQGSQKRAVHTHAAGGVVGAGGALPFQSQIQRAFGAHDVSSVRAHTGPAATEANAAMGSEAYVQGDQVAFAGTPDLHTAAHEAAHVVQQRAGLTLDGDVGTDGDAHEQQADAVADAVVAGGSAEHLLAATPASTGAPQKPMVQHQRRARQSPPAGAAPAAAENAPAANAPANHAPAAAENAPAANAPAANAPAANAPANHAPAAAVNAPAANHAPASGDAAQTIAQRFPEGITVAVALLPDAVDQAAARILGRGQMLSAEVQAVRAQLIDHPATTRVYQSLRAGDHRVTATDAHDIAEALAANDGAFRRGAEAFASGHRVVGGDPAAPTVGQPIFFHHEDNAVAMVRAVSRAVGPLPGGAGGNIRHLAIFTHGWHSGLQLGRFHGGANEFVAQLSGSLTHDVTIGMYGCSAAGDDSRHHTPSFAQNVTEGLAHAGHDTRVFGHENAAHATQNARGREFTAQAGQTTPATMHTNAEVVFTASFRAEQIRDIAQQINESPADVERVFDEASRGWLMRTMRRIRVPGGESAAFQIGFDPEGAAAACQNVWRREGADQIRYALHPETRPRPVRRPRRPAHH